MLVILGCSKCLKTFGRICLENGKSKNDYSGYNRETWPARTAANHINAAKKVRAAVNDKDRKTAESEYGARWSSLFQLPYLNCISDHALDPMHCLYLGKYTCSLVF